MKRCFIAVLICALALPAFATGVEEEEAAYQVQVMLIDGHDGLWDLTPTENTTPTAEQPIVRTAMATLKAEFEEMHPDTEIIFLRYPPMDRAGLSQWYATKRANDDLPQIGIDPLLTQMEGARRPSGGSIWLRIWRHPIRSCRAMSAGWICSTPAIRPSGSSGSRTPGPTTRTRTTATCSRCRWSRSGSSSSSIAPPSRPRGWTRTWSWGGYGDLIAVWQQLQEAGYIPYLPATPGRHRRAPDHPPDHGRLPH